MAENKKGFILYADLIHVVSKLPPKKAGELFLHILQYVNDENPTTDDLLLQLAFEPIKLQLKRDLVKFEETKDKKSNSGKVGNLKRWYPDLFESFLKSEITLEQALTIAENRKVSQPDKVQSQNITKIAVKDNVTVNDNVTVINNTNVINLNASCEFRFSVGKNVYQGLPSDLAKSREHLLYLNNWLSGKITIEEFSKVFDEDFKSKMFSNERHFQNSISATVKKIISNKNETPKSSYKRNNAGTEAIESGKIKDFSPAGF